MRAELASPVQIAVGLQPVQPASPMQFAVPIQRVRLTPLPRHVTSGMASREQIREHSASTVQLAVETQAVQAA